MPAPKNEQKGILPHGTPLEVFARDGKPLGKGTYIDCLTVREAMKKPVGLPPVGHMFGFDECCASDMHNMDPDDLVIVILLESGGTVLSAFVTWWPIGPPPLSIDEKVVQERPVMPLLAIA